MPITKSAKRALRKSLKRKERNLEWKRKIKNAFKEIKKLIAEKKIEEAKNFLPKVYKILDKAAKIGVIKERKADRIKSKISKAISKSQKSKVQEQPQDLTAPS